MYILYFNFIVKNYFEYVEIFIIKILILSRNEDVFFEDGSYNIEVGWLLYFFRIFDYGYF